MEDIRIYAFADEASGMVDEQILAMQHNGLMGVELRNVDGNNIVDLTKAQATELRDKLAAAGKVAWSIGSPIGKIGVDDDFEAHLDRLKNGLEVANILGAKNLRMFSIFMPKGEDPANYKNLVMDRLARFVETAKGSGVQLCHENEKGIYGDMAPRCLELLEAFPEMGGVFDPCNFIQCGQDTLEAWKLLKPYIKYMHIKDGLANGAVVPAGHGIGHLREIVTDFLAAGGRDFSIEPHLASFAGLSDLERESHRSKVGHEFIYDSNEAAFDAACTAFKALIEEVTK